MNKTRILIGICIAVFLSGIAGIFYVLNVQKSTFVNVIQDGNVIYSFDLAFAEDQTFDVEYKGRVNTIQIEDHKIRVLKAECPDQTCVHMGWLESGVLPIVCLPNHLSIEFADSNDDVDAVIQ